MVDLKPRPPAVTVALLVLIFTTSAWADKLDFKQCVDLALSQNPDLAISQAQIQQAEAALKQAQSNRLPRLNLSLTGTRTNDALNVFGLTLTQRNTTFNDFGAGEYTGLSSLDVAPKNLNYPDPVNNFNTRIELLVPVYNGGRVQSYVDNAKAYVRAAQQGDEMAKQLLTKQVLMAYQGVHTARAYIKLAVQAKAAAEEYVRITDRLLQQGMTVKSDLLSARVNLADIKVKLASAHNAEASALDQLHLLLGKPLNDPLDVGAPVMPAFLAGSDAELQAQAMSGNAGLRALRSQLEGAGAQVSAAQAGKLPQFNFMLRQDWNDPTLGFESSSYTLAGVLSWTAFDGGSTRAAIDRAESQRSELAARLRQAEDGIGYQVADARRKVLEVQDKIALREAAQELAMEAQRLVKKRYENGIATLVELLAAQTQLDKSNADLVAEQYELAVNRAELRRAAGVLTTDQL